MLRFVLMLSATLLFLPACASSDGSSSASDDACQPGDPQPEDMCCCDYGMMAHFECVDGQWGCSLGYTLSGSECSDPCGPCFSSCVEPDGHAADPDAGITVVPDAGDGPSPDAAVGDATGTQTGSWMEHAAAIPAVERQRVAAEVCADGFVDIEMTAGQHDGYLAAAQMRGFYLGLPDPEVYSGPRPVFLALNGTGGTGIGAFNEYAGTDWVDAGYIVLAPDSNANGIVWPSWYSMVPPDSPDDNNPDMIYFDSLLDCLAAHHAVDDNRLYVAGQSAGGIMTNYVLQHRPETFAGGVPASSIFDLTAAVPPLEMQPMAVIVMWGGDNDIWSGNSEQEGVSVPEIDFREQAAIASAFWEGVEGGHQVYCKGAELGHSWVHGANAFIREFMTAHPKGLAQNPGWAFEVAPMVTDGMCSEDVYEYEASLVVECGESETDGCQPFCQLLGDCLAENGTVAPVLGPSLEAIGFNGTDCSGCLTTCETTVGESDSAMSCLKEQAAAAQCGDGITGAMPAITAVNVCCPDKPESALCGMVCEAILSVSVALAFVEDGCAPWIPEVPCTSTTDCEEGQHCDFDDDACGWLGGQGVCLKTPEINCDEGGPGACGCSPSAVATNDCEIMTSGADYNSLGGCSPNNEDEVICGDVVCNRMTEYCTIAMNDVAGDDQPAWFASCGAAACIDPGPPTCACVPEGEQAHCHDTTGYPMVVTPGG